MAKDDQHVMPKFKGEPEHVPNETCWCEPEVEYVDPDTGAKVLLHKRPQ